MKKTPRFLVAVAFAASPTLAEETAITLKKDAGSDVVEGYCAACHSLDYILMNSPYPSAQLWDAEVTKMIKVFGAPINDKDAQTIKAYLAKNYGR